jgi:hypothetical protein
LGRFIHGNFLPSSVYGKSNFFDGRSVNGGDIRLLSIANSYEPA